MRASFWRRHGTTTGTVALAASLGVYVFLGRDRTTTREQEQRRRSVIPALQRDRVTEILVTRDGQSYRLRHTTTGATPPWVLEQAGQSETADAAAADKFVAALEFAAVERRLPSNGNNGNDRAAFGLTNPRLALVVVQGSTRSTIAVGGAAVRPEGALYMETPDGFAVTRKDTVASFDLGPDTFRERRLAPYLSTELAAWRWEGHHGVVSLVHDSTAGSPWRGAGSPPGRRVDRRAFERILTSFADLRADSFLPVHEADAAQQNAQTITVTMTPADLKKSPGVLRMGGACPEHPDSIVLQVLAPQPRAACVNRSVEDALAVSTDALADRHVIFAREDEIEELSLEAGNEKLELARKDKAWHQRAPVDADLEAARAQGLVRALTEADGELAPTEAPEPPELVPPRGKLTLRTVGLGAGGPAEIVEVGRPRADGQVPIRRTMDGAVLWLSRDSARDFLPHPGALRSPKVIDVPVDRVRRLAVTAGDLHQTLERSAEGTWRLSEPKGLPIDVGVAAEAAEAFAHLTAQRWVAESDDGSFGLESPCLRAELTVAPEGSDASPGKTFTIALGTATSGGYFARTTMDLAVFVVPRSFETILTRWGLDRGVFAVDPAEVATLTLQRGKQHVTLVAKNGRYEVDTKTATSGSSDLPAPRREAIAEALRDLRAVAAVHPGAPRTAEGFDRPQLILLVRLAAKNANPARPGKDIRTVLGASDTYQETNVVYARQDGIDATYALPAARIQTLLDPW